MKRELYNYFYEQITSRDDVTELAKRFPEISYNTLICIYFQKYQTITRKTLHKHKTPENIWNYNQRYLKGEELVDIAESINVAPCLLARFILQCHLGFGPSAPAEKATSYSTTQQSRNIVINVTPNQRSNNTYNNNNKQQYTNQPNGRSNNNRMHVNPRKKQLNFNDTNMTPNGSNNNNTQNNNNNTSHSNRITKTVTRVTPTRVPTSSLPTPNPIFTSSAISPSPSIIINNNNTENHRQLFDNTPQNRFTSPLLQSTTDNMKQDTQQPNTDTSAPTLSNEPPSSSSSSSQSSSQTTTTTTLSKSASNNLRGEISKRIKDPSLIEDERLRRNVAQCVECDDNYSPLVEKIRHITGEEYEYILQETLHNLGVAFMTEDEMRSKGYPKTPDVKLHTPILVNDRHVVYWIESKASFGDEYTHQQNYKDQFAGYLSRYGPGMVVYWFGFIDELQAEDENVMLVSDIPRDLVMLSVPTEQQMQASTSLYEDLHKLSIDNQ